jgi:chromosome partitioning protein
MRLREFFAAEGVSTKEYKPWRPEGLPPRSSRSPTSRAASARPRPALHLAMSAALDGYRVLVVDLDSQGSPDHDLRRPRGG